MACAKKINQISGTAHGKDVVRVVIRAVGHLILQGMQQCAGPCDGGICRFGLTGLNEEIQIVEDVHGKGVTVTVTGDGECFCS
jgi:hypothetical protein